MPDWRQWETASQAEWGLAVERESVIRPLVEEDKLSAARQTGEASRDRQGLRVEVSDYKWWLTVRPRFKCYTGSLVRDLDAIKRASLAKSAI